MGEEMGTLGGGGDGCGGERRMKDTWAKVIRQQPLDTEDLKSKTPTVL